LVPEQARLPVAFGFPFGRRFSIQKPIKTNTDKEKQVLICFARLPVFVGFSLFLLVFLKTQSVQPTISQTTTDCTEHTDDCFNK